MFLLDSCYYTSKALVLSSVLVPTLMYLQHAHKQDVETTPHSSTHTQSMRGTLCARFFSCKNCTTRPAKSVKASKSAAPSGGSPSCDAVSWEKASGGGSGCALCDTLELFQVHSFLLDTHTTHGEVHELQLDDAILGCRACIVCAVFGPKPSKTPEPRACRAVLHLGTRGEDETSTKPALHQQFAAKFTLCAVAGHARARHVLHGQTLPEMGCQNLLQMSDMKIVDHYHLDEFRWVPLKNAHCIIMNLGAFPSIHATLMVLHARHTRNNMITSLENTTIKRMRP